MLDTQITMEPDIARQHYLAYRRLKDEQRTAEDEEIQRSYLELSRGHGIINATQAIEAAGLLDDGRPRLAFCRASASYCYLRSHNGRFRFCDQKWPDMRYKTGKLVVPHASAVWSAADGKAAVPSIPPAHRPASSLSRYWLMWEVEDWEEVPRDPALLRRLNATTFSVLAVWDLTEVERMVLRGRQS